MRSLGVAFAAGLMFAIGLGLSGMTLPDRVLAFLDVTGDWDPTLLFVMVGAIGVHLPLRRLNRAPSGRDTAPASNRIDSRLVAGAIIFGIGWGLSGWCPGPVLVSLVSLQPVVLLFVAAMIAGMWLQRVTSERA